MKRGTIYHDRALHAERGDPPGGVVDYGPASGIRKATIKKAFLGHDVAGPFGREAFYCRARIKLQGIWDLKNAKRVQRSNRMKHRKPKTTVSRNVHRSKTLRRKTSRPKSASRKTVRHAVKKQRSHKPFAGVWGSGTENVYVKMKRTDLIGRIKDLRSKLGVDV